MGGRGRPSGTGPIAGLTGTPPVHIQDWMARRATSRLATSIEGLMQSTAHAVRRELRGVVRAFRSETETEIKRLTRRVDKLERQLGRLQSRRNGASRATARCNRDGCSDPALARGLCSRHYQQMRYRKKRRKHGVRH